MENFTFELNSWRINLYILMEIYRNCGNRCLMLTILGNINRHYVRAPSIFYILNFHRPLVVHGVWFGALK